MIETGCRPGELRTLQWSEVRGDYIVVLAEKAKDREERRIPIMPTLRDILDRRRKGPDGNDLAPDAHVFGSETGDGSPVVTSADCGIGPRPQASRTCTCTTCERRRGHSCSKQASSCMTCVMPSGTRSTTMTSTYLRGRVDSWKQAYERRRIRLIKKGPRAQNASKAESALVIAGGGNRTRTLLSEPRILSPVRLPVSPPRRDGIPQILRGPLMHVCDCLGDCPRLAAARSSCDRAPRVSTRSQCWTLGAMRRARSARLIVLNSEIGPRRFH